MNGFAVDVDLSNPGQLLACGGLLEASDRLWRKTFWNEGKLVTGRFAGDSFIVESPGTLEELIAWLTKASVRDVVLETKPAGRKTNRSKTNYVYSGKGNDPAILEWSGETWRLNSWSGEDFGRTSIKTFAGQMKGPKVVAHLLAWLRDLEIQNSGRLFDSSIRAADAATFGFDARKGRAALDLGFSPDAIGMAGEEFPALELFAAIGLQGFRPRSDNRVLTFGVWAQPLPVELARAAAACAFDPPGPRPRRFQFRLLGRKERSGVSGAPNDQYKAFTRATEIYDMEGD